MPLAPPPTSRLGSLVGSQSFGTFGRCVSSARSSGTKAKESSWALLCMSKSVQRGRECRYGPPTPAKAQACKKACAFVCRTRLHLTSHDWGKIGPAWVSHSFEAVLTYTLTFEETVLYSGPLFAWECERVCTWRCSRGVPVPPRADPGAPRTRPAGVRPRPFARGSTRNSTGQLLQR